MRFAFPFAVIALILFAPAASAGECGACRGRGETTCQKHQPPEAFEIRHSSWLSLECCLGSGARPCSKCGDAEAAQRHSKRRAELAAWLADLEERVDGPLAPVMPGFTKLRSSGGIRHCESANFRFHGTFKGFPVALCDVPAGLFKSLPSKSPQKRGFPPDQYDWILAKRAEDLFATFKEIFRNEGRFQSSSTRYVEDPCGVAEGKYDVFLWESVVQQSACASKYFGSAQELGIYKHGWRFTAAIGNHAFTRDDEALHRYLVHVLTHLFVEALDFNIGFDMPAWIPEGLAHYMEWKVFGNFRISCYFERSEPVSPPQRPTEHVLKMVLSGRARPAADLVSLNYNAMDQDVHCQIFSWFHFLIEETPREKFVRFVRDVKRTKDQVKSFRDAYGFSLIGIDEPWSDFVKAKYR